MNCRLIAPVLLVAAVLTSGCGGGSSTTPQTNRAGAITSSDPTTQLQRAAQSALGANLRLSNYVLWHNAVPAWAGQSTQASALAALRASARDRRTQGIRIRVLSSRLDIVRVQVDPSYESATAVVVDRGRVRPYRHGHPLGRVINLNERAQVELRRLGDAPRFVVWKVASVR